ncbi:hypothetical protein ACFBZI_09795 [Moraxella sp. ZJ142]|uniref:hypothetical protein n=1 Tax=Moraxella marmotae TaxID=3344520 RepID=UPI0035D49F74
MAIIVKTKEELKKAIDSKTQYFIVEGELAKEIKQTQFVTTLNKFALFGLAASVAAIVATPVTGGVSGAVGAAGLIGLSAAGVPAVSTTVLLAIVAVGGIPIILALFKGYDVKYTMHPTEGIRAEFKRK